MGHPSGSKPGGMMRLAPSCIWWRMGKVAGGGRGGMETYERVTSGSSSSHGCTVTLRRMSERCVRNCRKSMVVCPDCRHEFIIALEGKRPRTEEEDEILRAAVEAEGIEGMRALDLVKKECN